MANLPSNDDIVEQYFQSDFGGFSEVESDVDIPNALESSGNDDIIDDETWTDNVHNVEVRDFTEITGPIFPDVFNVEDESAKAYCDLMFSPNMIRTTVRQTNNYARWKMPTRTIDFVFN